MKSILISSVFLILSNLAMADALCLGKVKEIVKWSDSFGRDFSFSVQGDNYVTPYVQVKDELTQSLVLTAYVEKRTVALKWITPDVNYCKDGWSHYDELTGYFTIM